MPLEKEYWVVKCPNCGGYFCKERNLYGREIEKATCIYCEKKVFLGMNGRTFPKEKAQEIVRRKNAKGQDTAVAEFRTYRPKETER